MAQFRVALPYQFASNVAINPSSINASSVSVETFTINGINTDTSYNVDMPSLDAGVFIVGCRPTATNTLEISFWNSTLGAINPASQDARIIGF